MRICVLKNYIQAIVTTMSYSKYIPISDGFVRYVCAMRYNGTFYSSWTNSGEATNKRPSISEALSHALDKLVGPNCYKNLKLSSRTDAGVHALRNVLQVDLIRRRQKDPNGELLSAHTPYTVKKGLNHFLGENFEKLYITDVSTVNENNTENGDHIALNNTFDVRASSTGRKYIYHILCPSIIDSPICTTNESASTAEDKLNRQEKSSSSFSASSLNELEDTRRLLFHDNLMWVYRRPLNLRAMNQACAHLTGIHDFSSFRSSTCQSQTPYRQVTELRVFSSSFNRNHHWQDSNINLDKKEESFSENFYMEESAELVTVTITASSFLQRMVRNIVGCLVDVGAGNFSPHHVQEILEMKSQTTLVNGRRYQQAPAHGLYLANVYYNKNHITAIQRSILSRQHNIIT